MGLLSRKTPKGLDSVAKMVEVVIRELGLDPQASRLTLKGEGQAWGLMKGSAELFIYLIPGEDEGQSLQVVAPVIQLPEDRAVHPRLFRRLLELNALVLSGAAFGVKEDIVVLVADRSTRDLNQSEVRDMVLRVGHFADLYDDELVVQFGGRRHSD